MTKTQTIEHEFLASGCINQWAAGHDDSACWRAFESLAESPTRGLPTRKGGHMATFHSTALFGTQTRAEVMYDELRDLESRLTNPRHPFSGTVWHSRREARARVDYLRRALS